MFFEIEVFSVLAFDNWSWQVIILKDKRASSGVMYTVLFPETVIDDNWSFI
jgi:hypothetical protein